MNIVGFYIIKYSSLIKLHLGPFYWLVLHAILKLQKHSGYLHRNIQFTAYLFPIQKKLGRNITSVYNKLKSDA